MKNAYVSPSIWRMPIQNKTNKQFSFDPSSFSTVNLFFIMTKPVQRKKAKNEQPVAVSSSSEQPKVLNPKTQHYEFGGPIGAMGMIVLLPVLVLFLATSCDATGYPAKAFLDDWQSFLLSKLTKDFLYSLYDPSAFAVYFCYIAILAIFYMTLPGNNVPGTVLRDGTRHKYKMNGKILNLF